MEVELGGEEGTYSTQMHQFEANPGSNLEVELGGEEGLTVAYNKHIISTKSTNPSAIQLKLARRKVAMVRLGQKRATKRGWPFGHLPTMDEKVSQNIVFMN